MLINRDFQDYYDSAIGYGVDKKVVYDRQSVEYRASIKSNPSIIDAIDNAVRQLEDQRTRFATNPYGVFYIGFCGKIYTGLYARVDPKTGVPPKTFSYKEAHTLAKAFYWGEKDFLPGEFDQPRKHAWQRCRAAGGQSLREWYELNAHLLVHEALDVFIDHKVVSFVYLEGLLVTNPCLKDYNFQRMIGGVQAFQEISMFISGVLGSPERELVATEDKYIIMSKGFDEHSFRKAPTKRA